MGVGAALLIAGTVAEAESKRQAGKQEEKFRKQNAAIITAESERNARAAGEQAGQKRAEKRRLIGRQNVQFAKTGVRAGTGTSLLVREDSLRRIEAQAEILQERGTFARETGVSRAGLELSKGKAARRAGNLAAGTSLLTGFGTGLLLRGPNPRTRRGG